MRLGLINSAFAQVGVGTEEGLRTAKQIGFDEIDIFADPLDIDIRERELIRSVARQCELPIRSVCCVALGLVDFNASVQRFHIDRCREFLDLCYALDAGNLLLVLGEYVWRQEVIRPQDQWQAAVSNVRLLGQYARQLQLEIAIELEPFPLSLVNSADTMLRFLSEVDMPETVRANCDISHLYLVGEKPEAIGRLGKQIAHVHLSDCNGKVHGDLPPGRGVVPIASYVEALRDCGFDGTVSIELEYAPQPDRIVDWVKEAYAETAAILDALGCREK